MSFPIKVCVVCKEEFELKPGKPGFANRCPSCSEPEEQPNTGGNFRADPNDREANAARRKVIRDMLYRGDN